MVYKGSKVRLKVENFEFYIFFIYIWFFTYKPPFKAINRPWDPSRSIELEEIYILVDLELHRTYLGPIYPQGTQGGPPWTHGPMDPWALWTWVPREPRGGPWGPIEK